MTTLGALEMWNHDGKYESGHKDDLFTGMSVLLTIFFLFIILITILTVTFIIIPAIRGL